jgi:hypothetical protein
MLLLGRRRWWSIRILPGGRGELAPDELGLRVVVALPLHADLEVVGRAWLRAGRSE